MLRSSSLGASNDPEFGGAREVGKIRCDQPGLFRARGVIIEMILNFVSVTDNSGVFLASEDGPVTESLRTPRTACWSAGDAAGVEGDDLALDEAGQCGGDLLVASFDGVLVAQRHGWGGVSDPGHEVGEGRSGGGGEGGPGVAQVVATSSSVRPRNWCGPGVAQVVEVHVLSSGGLTGWPERPVEAVEGDVAAVAGVVSAEHR